MLSHLLHGRLVLKLIVRDHILAPEKSSLQKLYTILAMFIIFFFFLVEKRSYLSVCKAGAYSERRGERRESPTIYQKNGVRGVEA